MEPSIYKPSIYKGAGIYKAGAGGGGGGGYDIGGRTYRTVNIGGKIWLAENLDFKFSGVYIGQSGSPTTPAAWYYENNESIYGIDGVRKCGLIYNWYAVKLLNDNRSIICPGWHVPTNDEWTDLINFAGGTSNAGTKLKASNVSWATSWGGTDDYGFMVLPAGDRYLGTFYNVGKIARFWTSNDYSSNDAYRFDFNTAASVNVVTGVKTSAYSIRLVKD